VSLGTIHDGTHAGINRGCRDDRRTRTRRRAQPGAGAPARATSV